MTMPTAKERMPLEALIQNIARDLLMVFVGNGYRRVAFSLVATDPDTDETAIAGNLRVPGIKEQLTIVLEKIEAQEKERFRESLGLPAKDKGEGPPPVSGTDKEPS